MSVPRIARRVIALLAPAEWRASLIGDLEEERRHRLTRGHRAGAFWATAAALSACLHIRRARRRTSRAGTVVARRSLALTGQPIREAARTLLRRPARAALAVVTLTLGLAAVTSAFSLANWLMLRPIPGVAAPDQVVTVKLEVNINNRRGMMPISVPIWREIARQPALAIIGGAADASFNIATGAAPPERVQGAAVTTNYFDALRHSLSQGRAFGASDDDPGRANVAIISDQLHRSAFEGDPRVIGRVFRLNGQPFTVVGVAQRGFRGPDRMGRTDIWVPIASNRASLPQYPPALLEGPRGLFFSLVGRLDSGAKPAQLEAQLKALRTRLIAEHVPGSDFGDHTLTVLSGIEVPYWQREQLPQLLGLILAAAALLLVLACANAANLLLAHATARRAELATRQALGASRGTLIVQLIAEGLMLALISGAAALAAAVGVGRALAGVVVAESLPMLQPLPIDWRVLLFGIAAATLACLCASLAPAIVGSRVAPLSALAGHRGHTAGGRGLRRLLSGVQVAVAAALLAVALLLARSALARYQVPIGFDPAHVITFSIEPGVQGYDDAGSIALFRRLIGAVRATPGVEHAAAAWVPPFKQFGSNMRVRAVDRPEQKSRSADLNYISDGLFATLDARLVRGRDFTDNEAFGGAASVAIVNDALARALFGTDDVIGREVADAFEKNVRLTIVGVAADLRTRDVSTPSAPPAIYLPFRMTWGTLHARVRGPAATMLPAIREAVRAVDPVLPIYDVESLTDAYGRHLAEPRLVAASAALLAGLAIVLTSLGLYGVLVRGVEERRREFGIRNALGATPRQIARLVSREAAIVAGGGGAAGIIAALWLSGLIASRLFGVSARDPLSFAIAAAVVTCLAVASALLPARRAAAIDVVEELR